MATRNSRTTHPAMSQQIESKLMERKVDYDFEPNLRIADIRDSEEAQVRLIEHRAPKDQVERYSTAMKHGATFPAIVLNDRMEKIDGNTRLEATKKNGLDTIPAYICHNITTLEARSLSVELNQANGLAMTEGEIKKFIVDAVQDGEHPEIRSLSRMTGVKESKIGRWIAATKFQTRAQRASIDTQLLDRLPDSTRVALEATHLAPVFKELTVLAADAKLTAAEVKKLVSAVNAAPSETEALTIVATERDTRADQIKAVASGFKPRLQRKSAGSAQHFGALLHFQVEDLLDVDPERQFDTFNRVKIIRDRLDDVVSRAEQEWDLTPPSPEVDDETVAEEPGLRSAV